MIGKENGTSMDFDFMIVGMGIAGATLSRVLLQNGKRVLVIDERSKNNASEVAAGLFNPITGRKMVKTWLADELFPLLHRFYPEWEQQLETKFFFPKPIYVPFDSQEKQNDWLANSGNPVFQPYLSGFSDGEKMKNLLKGDFGGMFIRQSGHVELPNLLAAQRSYLQQTDALVETHFKEADLVVEPNGIRWNGHTAQKIVFCNGAEAVKSALFGWLPFRPVKGELLSISLENWPSGQIVNRGCWVLPWQDGNYKVGATYENHYNDLLPTQKGKAQVLEKLEALIKAPYKVLDHWAGLRPATYDRRPFVGWHPFLPQIGLLNGLGAKGVSLAPFMAHYLVANWQQEKATMPTLMLERVFKKWPGLQQKAKLAAVPWRQRE